MCSSRLLHAVCAPAVGGSSRLDPKALLTALLCQILSANLPLAFLCLVFVTARPTPSLVEVRAGAAVPKARGEMGPVLMGTATGRAAFPKRAPRHCHASGKTSAGMTSKFFSSWKFRHRGLLERAFLICCCSLCYRHYCRACS